MSCDGFQKHFWAPAVISSTEWGLLVILVLLTKLGLLFFHYNIRFCYKSSCLNYHIFIKVLHGFSLTLLFSSLLFCCWHEFKWTSVRLWCWWMVAGMWHLCLCTLLWLLTVTGNPATLSLCVCVCVSVRVCVCTCVCQCVCGGGVGGSGVSSEHLCASWCPRLSVLLTAAVYGNFNTKNTTKDVCRSDTNDFSWHFFSRETKSCFRPLCYSLEIPTAGVCIRFTPLEIIVSSWDQTGISGTLHNNSNNRNKPMTDLKMNPWWLLMSTKSLNKNH